tara:strand:+ start:1571 stop:2572 length:1002 start_codon:yes stop_codon:yes gene_type:complete
MIKNNFFFLKNLKNVCFLGQSNIMDQLVKINSVLKINSLVITSPDQKLSNKKNQVVFKKIDKKFKKYISKKFDTNETLFISLGARWIFKKEDIKNFFKKNLVNFHDTRLPLDAGGGPYSWRILRNDRIGMQLVHVVTEKIDKGDILKSEKYLFPHQCKTPEDFQNYHNSNFPLFYKNFLSEILKKKKIKLKSQVDYLGSYNPRLNTKTNGWIDWSLTSHEILNFINAFDNPYDGASTQILGHKRVYLKKAHLHGGEIANHPFRSGLISRNDKNWIVVSTKDSQSIIIEEVLDKNKKNIVSKLKVGSRFFTSPKNLFKAKSKKITYSSLGLKIN